MEIKESIWEKIYKGEKNKVINYDQQLEEIFIKEVAQAIPTLAMCCFKLLATLYDEINLMITEI